MLFLDEQLVLELLVWVVSSGKLISVDLLSGGSGFRHDTTLLDHGHVLSFSNLVKISLQVAIIVDLLLTLTILELLLLDVRI